MIAPPDGLTVKEDLHRIEVALRSGVDPLLLALGTGFGLVVGALILGRMGSVWPLLAVLVATAILWPWRRSHLVLDSDTLEVQRVEMGRRAIHRLPLHTITEVEAIGPTLRLAGRYPLVVTGIEPAAAAWLADRIRQAALTAVEVPPTPALPDALRQITEQIR